LNYLPQVNVYQRRQAPPLNPLKDRLPVGITLRQILDALAIGIRSSAGKDQTVFQRERRHGDELSDLMAEFYIGIQTLSTDPRMH
jgi:hypothetical protein